MKQVDDVLDGRRTTLAWQTSPLTTAVLPVGAFEQHGARLPLATDTLLADHFAGDLARRLPAALLPALPFASSTEHIGFRGTLSLRPETLMQVIRDLVESLEHQGFTRVVIVNGHGGNFFLGPVVRHLNAQDRPLKVLLVDCGREFDRSSASEMYRHDELHAGASEISRMLALHPELVRSATAVTELPQDTALTGFLRSDLNTFGIGYRHASGVWGDAAEGDPTTGAAMVASISDNLLAHVRERLAWLERNARYAGGGGIAVRLFGAADIEAGLRLCRAAGWNQKRADWEFFLGLRPGGCFAAVHMGRVVGTVMTADFSARSGCLSMLLVDSEHQRKGIGRLLLRTAIQSLRACPCVTLDATEAGKPLYRSEGFVDQFDFDRWVRPANALATVAAGGVRPMTAADVEAVAALDAQVFGVPRPAVIAGLLQRTPRYAHVTADAAGVTGFVLGRSGEHFEQLGPLMAQDTEQAKGLTMTVLRAAGARAVAVDACARPGWTEWLEQLGFRRERTFTRMVRGDAGASAPPAALFAVSGPELG